MARQYPRFLFSNPRGGKSEGPFVIHTISPRVIFRVTYDIPKDAFQADLLDQWDEVTDDYLISRLKEDLISWCERNKVYWNK